MPAQKFLDFHRAALECDEVRNNLILGLLGRLVATGQPELRLWTLGGPGACAMQTSSRNGLILGDLTLAQCRALAEATWQLDYPGVVGVEQAPSWFVEHAVQRGLKFAEPMPQAIHALYDKPIYPGALGFARLVEPADTELFGDWLIAFFREAAPHDQLPTREAIEKTVAAANYWFWIIGGEPVSMAGIVRRTRHAAAIAGVYTPPALRGRGYAGSVTAAVVESVFAEGRIAACLYSNLRNPASNRCYAKIGFKPVCR